MLAARYECRARPIKTKTYLMVHSREDVGICYMAGNNMVMIFSYSLLRTSKNNGDQYAKYPKFIRPALEMRP